MTSRLDSAAGVVSAAVLLAACGGGGGGGNTAASDCDDQRSHHVRSHHVRRHAGQRSQSSRHRRVARPGSDGAGDRHSRRRGARYNDDGQQRQLFIQRRVQHQPAHPRARRDDQDRHRADLEFLGPQQHERSMRSTHWTATPPAAVRQTALAICVHRAASARPATRASERRRRSRSSTRCFKREGAGAERDARAAFPALSLFWSEDNRPTAGRFCPDDGDIGTSSYIVFTAGEQDGCTPQQRTPTASTFSATSRAAAAIPMSSTSR